MNKVTNGRLIAEKGETIKRRDKAQEKRDRR